MQQWHRLIVFLCLFSCTFIGNTFAFTLPWQSNTLLTVNELEFTEQEFREWWKWWQEEGDTLQSIDQYVEWQLKLDEANRMELYTSPAFQRKIGTFLKAKTLMMLKREEIDLKIDRSPQVLREEYAQNYLPIQQVGVLRFPNIEAAQETLSLLNQEGENLEEVIKDLREKEQLLQVERKMLRPATTPQQWQQTLAALQVGQAALLEQTDKTCLLLYLKETIAAQDGDFEQMEGIIKTKLWKRRQSELTFHLVANLRQKYLVKIDEQLFESLDPAVDQPDIADNILISSERVQVSVGQFLEEYERYQNKKMIMIENLEERKTPLRWFMNTMISNSVITWESLDRHYEKDPPFSWVYRFYQENSLIKELEARLLKGMAPVLPADVETYYKNNMQQYRTPTQVKLKIFIADPAIIKDVWLQVLAGASIDAVVQAHPEITVQEQIFVQDKLHPELAAATQYLSVKEVSSPFSLHDKDALAQLQERRSEMDIPLDHVRSTIEQKLISSKKEEIISTFVNTLRKNSKITVNTSLWEKLRNELHENHDG